MPRLKSIFVHLLLSLFFVGFAAGCGAVTSVVWPYAQAFFVKQPSPERQEQALKRVKQDHQATAARRAQIGALAGAVFGSIFVGTTWYTRRPRPR